MWEVQDPQIILQPKQEVYRPGDQITGIVRVALTKDYTLGRIYVRLSGHEDSMVRFKEPNQDNSHAFEERTHLFHVESVIQPDQLERKAGQYDFPFELTLPESYRPQGDLSWKVCEGFLSDEDMSTPTPLPPTTSVDVFELQANIWYLLEAEIVSHRYRGRKRAKEIISVLPQRMERPIDMSDPQQYATCYSKVDVNNYRLLPQYAECPSLKRRIGIRMQSLPPRFTFYLHFDYPSVIQRHHKDPIPFIVKARIYGDVGLSPVKYKSSQFSQYPEITIKSFKIRLAEVTMARVQHKDLQASHTTNLKGTFQKNTDFKLGVRSADSFDKEKDLGNALPTSIDLGRACDARVTSYTPTFQSYQVSRHYYLVWTMKLECAGQKITVRQRSPEPVTVLKTSW